MNDDSPPPAPPPIPARPCERLHLRCFHYLFVAPPPPPPPLPPAASAHQSTTCCEGLRTTSDPSFNTAGGQFSRRTVPFLRRLIVCKNINITSVILGMGVWGWGGVGVFDANEKAIYRRANGRAASRFAMPRVRGRNGFGWRPTVR